MLLSKKSNPLWCARNKNTIGLASASTQYKECDYSLVHLTFLKVEKSKHKYYLNLRNMIKALNRTMIDVFVYVAN